MPIFNLKCPDCGRETRRLLPHLAEDIVCSKCEAKLVRSGEGPTTRVVEVRDNGLMPKKVEQLADIQDLVRDRSTKPE